jgi:glyoxylase-like metal-dependent hydrolase (beta-lactamase superfamily II)
MPVAPKLPGSSEVEVTDFKEQPDGSIRPVAASGFLKRKLRVDGADRQVALPEDDVRVLQVAFVDVEQGDGALVQTPSGKLITIDGGENQLFARFLAGRLRDTSPASRRPIDAMVVTHGDADHFAGLSKIRQSETEEGLAHHKRLFIHPERVFHNGLVKRPSSLPELERRRRRPAVGQSSPVSWTIRWMCPRAA